MTTTVLHVGYPKAGSTFLQEWFLQRTELAWMSGHPACQGSTIPLIGAALDGRADQVKYVVVSDENLLFPWIEPEDSLRFDVAARAQGAGPSAEEGMCDALARLFPDARVLMVVRGFAGMLLSTYSEYAKRSGLMSVEEALATLGPIVEHRFDYDRIHAIYRRAFGDRLLVLPYELLREDRDAFVAHIERWLDIPHQPCEVGRVNQSLSPEEMYWYPRLSKVVAGGAMMLGSRYGVRAYRAYQQRWLLGGRMRPVVRLLGRLHKGRVTAADLPRSFVDGLRGKADSFRDDPLFAPYAREYLFD